MADQTDLNIIEALAKATRQNMATDESLLNLCKIIVERQEVLGQCIDTLNETNKVQSERIRILSDRLDMILEVYNTHFDGSVKH